MGGSAAVRGNRGRAVLAGTLVALLLALGECTAPSTPEPSSDEPDGPARSVEVGVAGRTIYLWDPQTGDAEALFTAPARQGADAELSPDGSRLVYERQVLGGPTQIYVLEADGTERPLTDLVWEAYDPTWSPDGETIAFAGSRVGGSDLDIYTVKLAGGPPRRIAGTWKDDQHPDWSPDGTRIVFDARSGDPRSGRGAIWVTSVRTRNPRTAPVRLLLLHRHDGRGSRARRDLRVGGIPARRCG
jgi:Tol biopolymer transport system component